MDKINKGAEIIDLLECEGIQLDIKVKNTINMLAYEIFQEGRSEGVKDGVKLGIEKACNEIELSAKALKKLYNTEG
jgi:hypothetical protein